MDNLFIQDVYDTLQGLMNPGALVPGVHDAFASGTLCNRRYEEITDAYQRLRDRLGVVDEDSDVEVIINAFLDIQRELCFKMYEYGTRFGGMHEKAR